LQVACHARNAAQFRNVALLVRQVGAVALEPIDDQLQLIWRTLERSVLVTAVDQGQGSAVPAIDQKRESEPLLLIKTGRADAGG
jgi:hypothetical protein